MPRLANPDVGGPQAMDLARTMLAKCRSKCKHRQPGAKVTHKTPKRVIENLNRGGENDLRLSVQDDAKSTSPAHYVALSYCWGELARYQATIRENVQARQQEFSSRDLPATIRDATAVIYNVGFRHLWVDSMCIVQYSQANKRAR